MKKSNLEIAIEIKISKKLVTDKTFDGKQVRINSTKSPFNFYADQINEGKELSEMVYHLEFKGIITVWLKDNEGNTEEETFNCSSENASFKKYLEDEEEFFEVLQLGDILFN